MSHRKIVSVQEQLSSPGHSSVGAALVNLAALHCMMVWQPSMLTVTVPPLSLSSQENYSEAVVVYDQALKVYKSCYGSDHPLVTETIRHRKLAVDYKS